MMHWTATLRDQNLPKRARVRGDLACVTCGYNLRRAKYDGRCPECGTDVRTTVRAVTHRLALDSPLSRLAACNLAVFAALIAALPGCASIPATIVLFIAATAKLFAVRELRAELARGDASPFAGPLGVLFWCVLAELVAVGVWFGASAVVSGASPAGGMVTSLVGVAAPAWGATIAVEWILFARLGDMLYGIFGYRILWWESRLLLVGTMMTVVGPLFLGLAMWGLSSSGADALRAAFGLGGMGMIACTVLGSILMLHLSNASTKTGEDVDDLLEPEPE